jgi:hypothetical protein
MRATVIAIGGVLLGAAALGFRCGAPLGAVLAPAGLGVLILLGTLAERITYKPLQDGAPGPDWQATDERFVDPDSGAVVTVYFHERTGERRYVRRRQAV